MSTLTDRYAEACERAAAEMTRWVGSCDCQHLDPPRTPCFDCSSDNDTVTLLRALAQALREGDELDHGMIRGKGIVSIMEITLPTEASA